MIFLTDRELILQLMKKVEDLTQEVSFLRERLSKYENPKNSRNSSIPPSKDENRPKKNQSLRRSTGKTPGGQPGRKGRTLEITSKPDHDISLVPNYCKDCGLSLENVVAIKEKTRQIVDIPPIKAVWTQYSIYSKRCSCGKCNIADFPQGVKTPVSYGNNIEALISYLHTRQYLPFLRMKEMINDVFNIGISEGGLHYLLNRFADKATPYYNIIKQKISNSTVIGTDETGVKVNGDKHWFWTWQNSKLTYIVHSNTRGKLAIETNFPQGFPNAVMDGGHK